MEGVAFPDAIDRCFLPPQKQTTMQRGTKPISKYNKLTLLLNILLISLSPNPCPEPYSFQAEKKKMGDHPQITIQVHPTPPGENFRAYTVRFFHHRQIRTTLTSNVDVVEHWVSMIWNRYSLLRNPLLVGFGVFWSQTFPPAPQGWAATIQICIDGFCLIWQLREVVPFGVPDIVQQFFLHPDVRLVGVDNGMHAPLLREHHGIQANPRDWRYLAVARLGDFRLATESTMRVASAVFQFEVPETPFDVFLSNWDAPVLAPRQVLHAAVYAFVSYRIGMVLHAYDW